MTKTSKPLLKAVADFGDTRRAPAIIFGMLKKYYFTRKRKSATIRPFRGGPPSPEKQGGIAISSARIE